MRDPNLTIKELQLYIDELSTEKLRVSVQLRLARARIEELEQEVERLKSVIENF
jgi:FtsZ-binding cell division protein ZapB